MAPVYLTTWPGSMKVAYTVDQAVGQGCPNRRDDVYLVQLLLRLNMQAGGGEPGYCPPSEQPISVDGSFGPQTMRYIKFFQTEGNRRHPDKPSSADGVVTPPLPGAVNGPITGKFYTIFALNVEAKIRIGVDRHADIINEPAFPQELKKSFYVG